MATYDITQGIPSKIAAGDILNCPYSKSPVYLYLPAGTYKLQCWGAQGGSYNSTYAGGKGGYAVGTLTLTETTLVFIMVGGQGTGGTSTTAGTRAGGYNGGGTGYTASGYIECGGGGGTDIRIGVNSFRSRVIVAGGGGGSGCYYTNYRYSGGYGGGTTGGIGGQYSTSYRAGVGGSQTARGSSYYGSTANSSTYGNLAVFGHGAFYKSTYACAGGGGGWYGGGYGWRSSGGGGSGYVYTASTASNNPVPTFLDSKFQLTDASIAAGNTTFVGTSGSNETGHAGNGYARITVISAGTLGLNTKSFVNGSVKNSVINGVKVDGAWKRPLNLYFRKDGLWRDLICGVVGPTERELPGGYTQVEYVETDGNAHADLGYILTPTTSTMEVVFDLASSSGTRGIIGARDAAGAKSHLLWTTASVSQGLRLDCLGTSGTTSANAIPILNYKYYAKMFNNTLVINNNSIASTVSKGTAPLNYTCYLGSTNNAGTASSGCVGKFYYARISEPDGIKMELIPAKNSSNEYGFYDTVGGAFYKSVTSTAFTGE